MADETTHVFGDDIRWVTLVDEYDRCRKQESTKDFLARKFDQYIIKLENALEGSFNFLGCEFEEKLEKEIITIKKLCKDILTILEINDTGKRKETLDKAYQVFDSIEKYLITYKYNSMDRFFRIRKKELEQQREYSKEEMFHIKMTDRHLIGAFRYSLPGTPCLYLASSLELAWLECGMPNLFSYCIMRMNKEFKLVDFSTPESAFLANIEQLFNEGKREKDNVREYYIKHLVTFPLKIACSIEVKNRNGKFVEEYIIPQLLMQWMQEKGNYDGIAYESASYNIFKSGRSFQYNIVLFDNEFNEQGYGKNLIKKINISDISDIDIRKQLNDNLEEVNNLFYEINEIKTKLMRVTVSYDENYNEMNKYILNLMDICDWLYMMYNKVIPNYKEENEHIFKGFEIIQQYVKLMINSNHLEDKKIPEYEELKILIENFEQKLEKLAMSASVWLLK